MKCGDCFILSTLDRHCILMGETREDWQDCECDDKRCACLREQLGMSEDDSEIVIIITRRPHDIHACYKGHPEMWGCGKSVYEAVGNCVSAHTVRLEETTECSS